MDDTLPLAEALDELVSAEDFLDYFDVAYEARVVQVNRLHILQRFGFKKLKHIQGGIDAWATDVDPEMARY